MAQSIKKTKKISFALLIVSLSVLLYAHFMILDIRSDGEAGETVVTLQAVCLLVMEVISLFMVFSRLKERKTPLYTAFFTWVLWLLVDFFVFGLRGNGISNYFLMIPSACSFFYYYHERFSNRIDEKSIVFSYVIMLLYTGFLCISVMLAYKAIYRGEDTYVSNLIFWPLCATPFILLIEKRFLKWFLLAFLAILVVLTAKRSASICYVSMMVFYLIYAVKNEYKGGKKRSRLIFGILLVGVISFFLIERYMSTEFMALTERFSTVKQDQGTGRISIYKNVFAQMQKFSFDQFIVGRGFHSIRNTGHTNAHNDALQTLYEYGIIGLVIYLLVSIYAIKRLFYVRKFHTKYYPGYLSSIVIYIVLGSVSNLYAYNTYFIFICAYWGIVEGVICLNNKKNVQNSSYRNI